MLIIPLIAREMHIKRYALFLWFSILYMQNVVTYSPVLKWQGVSLTFWLCLWRTMDCKRNYDYTVIQIQRLLGPVIGKQIGLTNIEIFLTIILSNSNCILHVLLKYTRGNVFAFPVGHFFFFFFFFFQSDLGWFLLFGVCFGARCSVFVRAHRGSTVGFLMLQSFSVGFAVEYSSCISLLNLYLYVCCVDAFIGYSPSCLLNSFIYEPQQNLGRGMCKRKIGLSSW